MNAILMQIVIDYVLFLELSDDTQINQDTAVQQLEQIAWMLRKLTPTEQTELVNHLRIKASEARHVSGQERRWQCLMNLPKALGLTNIES